MTIKGLDKTSNPNLKFFWALDPYPKHIGIYFQIFTGSRTHPKLIEALQVRGLVGITVNID